MSNVEKLKEYLIGKNGYLLNEISNGKVIMLSGEWGSGKTHFWKNEIEPKLGQSIYISLYGKKSISDIENEILSKSFFSEFSDKEVKNISTFGNIAKNIVNIMAPKIGEKLEDVKTNIVNNFGKNFLQQGSLLCFDDFERKSKDVDLNDLFGFITQLALNFNCKIVLILNSDIFEGKEKAIFTNVKEKTISKYLKYTPTCAELFEIIFQDNKYKTLKEEYYAQTIQRAFCEVGIVNARILIQILDNLLEWYEKNMDSSTFFIRYFVLVNINFILNHHVFEVKLDTVENTTDLKRAITGLFSLYKDSYMSSSPIHSQKKKTQRAISKIKTNVVFDFNSIQDYLISERKYNHNFVDNLKVNIQLGEREEGLDVKKADYGDILIDFVNTHQFLCKSLHYMYCFKLMMYAKEDSESEVNTLNSINTFIETGIL